MRNKKVITLELTTDEILFLLKAVRGTMLDQNPNTESGSKKVRQCQDIAEKLQGKLK